MLEPPRRGTSTARHVLLRLAVLPAALVASIATAVVAYLLGGPGRPTVPPPGGDPLWGVLAGAGLLAGAVVTAAAVAAAGEAGTQTGRLAELCRLAARGRVELQSLLRKLECGERIRPPEQPPAVAPEDGCLGQLREEITALRCAAEAAVAEATTLPCDPVAPDERQEVYVKLARRVQHLVHRQIECLDELRAEEAMDSELLAGLCHIDHQAVRIRRHAENLALIGGSPSPLRWGRPVRVCEVLRSCVAESECHSRVTVAPPVEGAVLGYAVADLVHLLVELIQNATDFSPPQTQVVLRARRVTAGLTIEVEDRGLGLTTAEQGWMNALLTGAGHVDVGELLDDGRVGLFVVATLARRHRIGVELQSNLYGGVQAVVVLPHELLVGEVETPHGLGHANLTRGPATPTPGACERQGAGQEGILAPPRLRHRPQHLVPPPRNEPATPFDPPVTRP